MTYGTVHTFDPRRGRGTARFASGALVPFSSPVPVSVGDRIALSVTGGMAGVYGRLVLAA